MSVSASEMERLVRASRSNEKTFIVLIEPPIEIQEPDKLVLSDDTLFEPYLPFARSATIYGVVRKDKKNPSDKFDRAMVVFKTKPIPDEVAKKFAYGILNKNNPTGPKLSTENSGQSLAELYKEDGASALVFPHLRDLRVRE